MFCFSSIDETIVFVSLGPFILLTYKLKNLGDSSTIRINKHLIIFFRRVKNKCTYNNTPTSSFSARSHFVFLFYFIVSYDRHVPIDDCTIFSSNQLLHILIKYLVERTLKMKSYKNIVIHIFFYICVLSSHSRRRPIHFHWKHPSFVWESRSIKENE